MARRNRPRVVWLPATNAFSIDQDGRSAFNTATHDLTGDAGEFVTSTHGVVIDGEGLDPLAAGTTLSDIENSGYRLRRIVGDVWVAVNQLAENTPPTIFCSAGLMVLRVRPETGLPLDSNDHYGVNNAENVMDPWIWERSWLLSNKLSTGPIAPIGFQEASLGTANSVLGGNADGTHIDQKTARVIGPEERLFLILSSTVAQTAGQQEDIIVGIQWFWKLRCLASMRVSVGNRRNASR